jgi:lysophospholipase L1-like esterase
VTPPAATDSGLTAAAPPETEAAQLPPEPAPGSGVAVRGPVVARPRQALASRPLVAVYYVLLLAGITEWMPGLERLRLFGARPGDSVSSLTLAAPALSTGEARIENETRERVELAQPEKVELPKSARGPVAQVKQEAGPAPIDEKAPPIPITDSTGDALTGFYRSLERTSRQEPGAITRILYFGDSIVTSDYVSGTLRRKLQAEFGDAGHGFSLLANAWPAYFHNDVYRFASSGWLVSRVVGPLLTDGIYGLGGVSFRAPPGARARVGTAKKGRFGRQVARFELAYYRCPEGGTFELKLDGQPLRTIDTAGTPPGVAYETVTAPDGEHELELVTTKGYVRAFGVVMERDTPGVVLDALGIQGARARFLDQQDDQHFAEQLRWRKPSLIVYQFGANESADGFAYPMVDYHRTLVAVLRQAKQAVPGAGCLVLGTMDRAERRGDVMTTVSVVPALVEEQRRASAETGCAFFSLFHAMGGMGSMGHWVRRGLGQADLTHPTGAGSEVLATWIYRALVNGYQQHRARERQTAR